MAEPSTIGPSVSAPSSAGAAVLDVRGVGVTYGRGDDALKAIADVSFTVRSGEFLCVVGPSGCGKTTLLKSIAGLLAPSKGEVYVEDKRVQKPLPGLALVFQEYTRSLMPWLNVKRNVTFPLAAKGLSKREQDARADAALHEVGLQEFENKYPWQLSGGMQQRVAIARAVAYQPSLLLMDEPFASVDAQTRADLEDLMLRIQEDTGVTVLFVTHDIDEAVYLSERVVVLSGRPTRVKAELTVDLPYPRDQLRTRALPKFVELRTEILAMIQAERRAGMHGAGPVDDIVEH